MDYNRNESDLCTFQCKKWTLVSFCLLGIMSTLIIVIVLCVALNNLPSSDPDKQGGAIAAIASIGSICIMFEMVGLLGAYREHYCLTMTYAILMFIMTWGSIGGAMKNESFWFTFIINVMITTLAFLYARDLRRRQFMSHTLYVAGGPPPVNYPTVPVVNNYPAPPAYGATPGPPTGTYPAHGYAVAATPVAGPPEYQAKS